MTTEPFLSIPNWDELQHYKDRSPPWIKLQNSLLEDYKFECLPDASKAHLICIMLLASRINNRINPDPKWIARKIGASSKVDIDVLINSGFLQSNQPLPSMGQDASNAIADSLPRVEESIVEEKKGRFVKPSFNDLENYKQEKQLNLDSQSFLNHYDSNGWKVGKNPMKDWQATARNWATRQGDFNGSAKPAQKAYKDFPQ